MDKFFTKWYNLTIHFKSDICLKQKNNITLNHRKFKKYLANIKMDRLTNFYYGLSNYKLAGDVLKPGRCKWKEQWPAPKLYESGIALSFTW